MTNNEQGSTSFLYIILGAKKQQDDSIYYELDEKGDFKESEPKPSGASFSKHSDNVLLNAPQHKYAGMYHCGMYEEIKLCFIKYQCKLIE